MLDAKISAHLILVAQSFALSRSLSHSFFRFFMRAHTYTHEYDRVYECIFLLLLANIEDEWSCIYCVVKYDLVQWS